MPPRTQRFNQSRSVVLDATGAGEVVIFPTGGDWVIVRQSLTVSSNVLEPTARIYRGSASAANFIEGSFSGSNDASDTRIVLQQGADEVRCVWAGGDVGARATYSVQVVQYPTGQAPPE